MTTPLEREILTHYWTRATPFLGGSEHWTKLHCEIVERFVAAGLLIQNECRNGEDRPDRWISANCDALEPYMDALAAVPLPERRWVVPSQRT